MDLSVRYNKAIMSDPYKKSYILERILKLGKFFSFFYYGFNIDGTLFLVGLVGLVGLDGVLTGLD